MQKHLPLSIMFSLAFIACPLQAMDAMAHAILHRIQMTNEQRKLEEMMEQISQEKEACRNTIFAPASQNPEQLAQAFGLNLKIITLTSCAYDGVSKAFDMPIVGPIMLLHKPR